MKMAEVEELTTPRSVASLKDEVTERLAEEARRLRLQAQDAYDDAAARLRAAAEDLRLRVAEAPAGALLIACVAGLLIGLLLNRPKVEIRHVKG